jgi:hypothetical protein
VRQALMNVLSRHAAEVCPTDYELAEDLVHHYAAAYSRDSREDPRDRVFMGSWSTHRKHRPDCDCRSRMRRSPRPNRSGRYNVNEHCLRQVKRRRRRLLELNIFVIRKRSEKGGMLKASKFRRARGNAHVIWVGPEVEAEIRRLQHINRGAPPPPPPPIPVTHDVEVDVNVAKELAQIRRPLSSYLTPDGRRRLLPQRPPAADGGRGPQCSCERCMAEILPLLAGPGPPPEA